MSQALRAALVTVFGLTLLAGCTDDKHANTVVVPSAEVASWGTDPAAAAAGDRLGRAGSRCTLPVSFKVAKSWKPSAISGGFAARGDFTLRCELDAKPAGHLGFLRVWASTTPGTDPAPALDAFLDGQSDVVGRQTRVTTAGELPAVESTYLTENAELGVRRQERLLAVGTANLPRSEGNWSHRG